MKYIRLVLLFVALLWGSVLFAQADQIELTGCTTTDNNVRYTASGFQKNGAPCYISEIDSFLTIELSVNGWIFGEYLAPWTPCNDVPFASNLYSSDLNTDVTQVDSDGTTCGTAASISEVASIPTIGQWGLMTLFVLLIVMGVTTLKQQIHSVYS